MSELQIAHEEVLILSRDREFFKQEHTQAFIRDFYERNPDIPKPERLHCFSVWQEVPDKHILDRRLTRKDCIYVVGGFMGVDIDLDEAIVLTSGGNIGAHLACGRYHTFGGRCSGEITTRLGPHYSRGRPNRHGRDRGPGQEEYDTPDIWVTVPRIKR